MRSSASDAPGLHLVDVDEALTQLKAIKGAGLIHRAAERLRDLMRRATRAEQTSSSGADGESGTGSAEAILVDAVATSAPPPGDGRDDGRHARAPVARASRDRDPDLDSASSSSTAQPRWRSRSTTWTRRSASWAPTCRSTGRRAHPVHKSGDDVRVHTEPARTPAVPEVVAAARQFAARDAIRMAR
jgi:hypothetical protein